MDKLIKVSHGALTTVRNESRPSLFLEKTSSDREGQCRWLESDVNQIDPRIVSWIRSTPLDHARYAYALVVPLGADESWEETVNGDAFERADLAPEDSEFGHKTFETHARAFRHHVNHDPTQGFGDNPFMVFNTQSDRCEGIWRLDRAKAQEVGATSTIDKLEGNRVVNLSMGCRVKFDRCSVCGNEAPSPAKYCQHPKAPGFGHIDPRTGVKVRVFNPRPLFFDLSDVTIPAAPESATLGHLGSELEALVRGLTKTSGSLWPVLPSALLASAVWSDPYEVVKLSQRALKSSAFKLSDLVKYAPAMAVGITNPLRQQEPPVQFLPSPRVQPTLATLAGLGVVLSFREFCELLIDAGELPAGSRMTTSMTAVRSGFQQGMQGPLMDSAWFSPSQARHYSKYVEDRSLLMPHLGRRASCLPENPGTGLASEFGAAGSSPLIAHGQDIGARYGQYVGQVTRSLGQLMKSLRDTLSRFDATFLGAEDSGQDLTVTGTKQSTRLDPALQSALPSSYLLSYVGLASDPDMMQIVSNTLGRR